MDPSTLRQPGGAPIQSAIAPRIYRVMHPRVAIRAGPSTDAAIVSLARAGSEVEGCERRGNWIKLAPGSAPRRPDAAAAWMMLDGAEVATGGEVIITPLL
jgi:hypothetical protein